MLLKISGICNLVLLGIIGILILVVVILSKRLTKKKKLVFIKERQAELEKAKFKNVLLKEKHTDAKEIDNCNSIDDCLRVLDDIVSNHRNKRNRT